MKKTKTEYGYTLENTTYTISVFHEWSFGKKRNEYVVTEKATDKTFFPSTLSEAKEIARGVK
jgi:hypothetical protein